MYNNMYRMNVMWNVGNFILLLLLLPLPSSPPPLVSICKKEVRERQSHKCVDGYDDVDVEGKKKPRRTKYLYPYIHT